MDSLTTPLFFFNATATTEIYTLSLHDALPIYLAAREKMAVFDQTGFGKLVLRGRDATPTLQRLCGNNVDVPVGKVVYTGIFNERGGFESDLTVVRVGTEEFYLITGTAQPMRDVDWIHRHLRAGEHVTVCDVTNSFGVLG